LEGEDRFSKNFGITSGILGVLEIFKFSGNVWKFQEFFRIFYEFSDMFKFSGVFIDFIKFYKISEVLEKYQKFLDFTARQKRT
jgi:hypothetical protein